MHISAFHIEGFGILSNIDVEYISPGLTIFFGQNEAGKSTCLEFLRSMLTGFPQNRQKREFDQKWKPVNGGRLGGSLVLTQSQDGHEQTFKLSRTKNDKGDEKLQIIAMQGRNLDKSFLDGLFAGIDRDVYSRIFGFSLGELEQFETLGDEAVKNALYGASFGPELRSPGEVLKEIEKQKEKILRKNPDWNIKKLASDLKEVRNNIFTLQTGNAEYDRLKQSLEDGGRELQNLSARRRQLEKEARSLERRLDLWERWENWRLLMGRLERISIEIENFPEDGANRYQQLREKRENLETRLGLVQKNIDALKEKRNSISFRPSLLEESNVLQALSERKASYRQASLNLNSQQDECLRAEEDLASNLLQLGPDWDCERIRSVDRSVFTIDEVEKNALALNDASAAYKAAVDYLQHANLDVEHANNSLKEAQTNIELIPQPPADMKDADRDLLRKKFARLEDARNLTPQSGRNLEQAAQDYRRSLEHIKIFSGQFLEHQLNGADPENGQQKIFSILENLQGSQDEADKITEEMRTIADEKNGYEFALRQAQENAENLKHKMEALKASQSELSGVTRSLLDSKFTALRSLRTIVSNMDAEKNRQKELESRLQALKDSAKPLNWLWPCAAFLLICCGIVIFLALKIWNINNFNLGSTSISLYPEEAYIAFFIAAVILAAIWHSIVPDRKKRKNEMEHLQSRLADNSRLLQGLNESFARECRKGEISALDVNEFDHTAFLVTLDGEELLLERSREKYFQEEHVRQDLRLKDNEYVAALRKCREIEDQMGECETRIQQCRRRWHSLMTGLGINIVPSPEGASATFAKVETAMVAYANLERERNAANDLWSELHLLEDEILKMSVIAQCFKDASEPPSLETAVRQTLDKYREADEARDKLIAAEATLQSIKKELERALERQEGAKLQCESARTRQEEAKNSWQASLKQIGFGESLSPQTVREAFECMKNCLADETRLLKARNQLSMLQEEIESFEKPLGLFIKNHLPQLFEEQNEPNWLALLDLALEQVAIDNQHKVDQERLNLSIEEKEEEFAGLKVEWEMAEIREKELLRQANAENGEDFLRKSKEADEKRELLHEKDFYEIAFTEAARAASQGFDEFVNSFSDLDRETENSRLADMRAEIESINNQEKQTSQKIGADDATLSRLCNSTTLSDCLQEEAMLSESLRRVTEELARYSIAAEILKAAKSRFENERQPEVLAHASKIFAQITNNQWMQIHASLENSSLYAVADSGEHVSPEYLSRGAQEQLYLALRLAYVRDHAIHSGSLPVIMDEILVNFDPDRAERTAMALAEMTRENGSPAQQIIYFTCQPYMIEILRAASPGAPLYRFSRGKLSIYNPD